MSTRDDIKRLLDRIEVLENPCDLDLFLFFARHPQALLTSEQLAAWLGYELAQIAGSLDKLLSAGLLTRMQNRAHAARLYVFAPGVAGGGGGITALLALASTRTGRLAIREELVRRLFHEKDAPEAHQADQHEASRPRPFVVRRRSGDNPRKKAAV
jgi:hypothetical protein